MHILLKQLRLHMNRATWIGICWYGTPSKSSVMTHRCCSICDPLPRPGRMPLPLSVQHSFRGKKAFSPHPPRTACSVHKLTSKPDHQPSFHDILPFAYHSLRVATTCVIPFEKGLARTFPTHCILSFPTLHYLSHNPLPLPQILTQTQTSSHISSHHSINTTSKHHRQSPTWIT